MRKTSLASDTFHQQCWEGKHTEVRVRVLHPICTFKVQRGKKGLFVLLSRTQAGPGRTVKQEQEQISRNHVQTFIYLSVHVRFFYSEDGLCTRHADNPPCPSQMLC